MSKFSEKAVAVVQAVAPTLGAALGGPLGGAAGVLLSKALGQKDGVSTDAVSSVIASGSPEVIAAITKAEADYQQFQLGLLRLTTDDRASARNREVQVKDRTPAILAYVVIGATLFLEGWGMLHGFPTDIDQVILGRILGTLDAASLLVLGYYFGTTASSHRKDDIIGEIAKMP